MVVGGWWWKPILLYGSGPNPWVLSSLSWTLPDSDLPDPHLTLTWPGPELDKMNTWLDNSTNSNQPHPITFKQVSNLFDHPVEEYFRYIAIFAILLWHLPFLASLKMTNSLSQTIQSHDQPNTIFSLFGTPFSAKNNWQTDKWNEPKICRRII